MNRIPHFGTLRRIARVLQIAQIAALTLIVGLGTLLWRNIEEFRQADVWVDHSHDVRNEINQVRSLISAGGLALGNYVISPRPEFLDAVAKSSVDSKQATVRLLQLVADQPVQTARAHKLSSEASEIVGWYQSSEVIARRDRAGALIASLSARVNIDASFRLRNLLEDMDVEEQMLLETRR